MRIKLDVEDSTIFTEINRAMIGNILAGMEEIAGHKGTHYWTVKICLSEKSSFLFLETLRHYSNI